MTEFSLCPKKESKHKGNKTKSNNHNKIHFASLLPFFLFFLSLFYFSCCDQAKGREKKNKQQRKKRWTWGVSCAVASCARVQRCVQERKEMKKVCSTFWLTGLFLFAVSPSVFRWLAWPDRRRNTESGRLHPTPPFAFLFRNQSRSSGLTSFSSTQWHLVSEPNCVAINPCLKFPCKVSHTDTQAHRHRHGHRHTDAHCALQTWTFKQSGLWEK